MPDRDIRRTPPGHVACGGHAMPRILLQTTVEDDAGGWNVERFGRLIELLSRLRDRHGRIAFQVTARNRTMRGAPDPVLSRLDGLPVDQLWLLATDEGGLTAEDRAGIDRFRHRGGGLMVARGSTGPGCPIREPDGLGTARLVHGHPPQRRGASRGPGRAGAVTAWAGYHSGADGEFQRVRPVGNIHPVMRDRHSATGVIQYLPSHPHEGAVGVPPGDAMARVIMDGHCAASGRRFNIAVATEHSDGGGRAIAQSSFHHFADDNWDPAAGRTSTASGSIGNAMVRFPEALRSVKQYVRNVAFWLGG